MKKSQNNFTSSKWFYIMKAIFSTIYIPDFSEIKDLENGLFNNNIFNKDNIKSYEIDKLQYFYLKNICIKKLKKIQYLSFKLKISLNNIIDIYFDLCIKEMFLKNKRDRHILQYISKNNGNELFNGKFRIINPSKKNTLSRIKIRRQSIHNAFINLNSLKNDNSLAIKNKKQEDDVITNIINKKNNTIDILEKRSKSTRPKLLYCNSFTRLFIGETDKESILKRHLSNILVLKNNLNVNGTYVDLSKGYIKKIFYNLYQKNKRQLLIDDYLKKTFEKYKFNQKYLDEYNKKNTSIPKKSFYIKKSKFMNAIDIPFDDNLNIEEQMLKSYYYDKDKNKHKKLRKTHSAQVKKFFILNENKNKNKNIKKDQNESSILIENLCKELSDSNHISIPNVNNNKHRKKNLWIKTENNILQNYNYFYTGKKYNNSHQKNIFRTNTLKNSNCLKKNILKIF